ncbi:hypothetical protein EON65_27215, partial [archaeon]
MLKKLKNPAPEATPVVVASITTTSSSTSRPALDAPLKTGREYAPKKEQQVQPQGGEGAHRLLNSALQTSRTGPSHTPRNPDQRGAGGDRNRIESVGGKGGYKR